MTISDAMTNKRGSALLITFFVALVMTGLVYCAFQYADQASRNSRLWANKEKADYVADYAAKMVVAELPKVVKNTDHKVVDDWVSVNFYRDSNGRLTTDQRRVGGMVDDYDFRVKVRSARAAFASGTADKGWLNKGLLNSDFVPGVSAASEYNNIYEIVSTARNVKAPSDPMFAYAASLHGIIDMNRSDHPDSDKYTPFSGADALRANLNVSGEDHGLKTETPNMVASTQPIITGATQVKSTSESRFENGNGDYWTGGSLTLGYMVDDRPVVDGKTAAQPNPLAPRTANYSDTVTSVWDEGQDKRVKFDRMMITKFDAYAKYGKEQEFFNQQPVGLRDPKDTIPAPDLYFIGGKAAGSHSVTPDPDDTVNGYVKEKSSKEAEAIKSLNVTVGSYEDLKRFYIVHLARYPGTTLNASTVYNAVRYWRVAFVGEWTKNKYKTKITYNYNVFDNSNMVARRRSFSKHYPRSKDKKILAHEMVDSTGKITPDGKFWTGRYFWSDYKVTGNSPSAYMANNNYYDPYTGKTRSNQIIYPREFTWEEIQSYKSVKDSTGYPICDNLGRETLEYDEDGKPIDMKLEEYCFVDANGELATVEIKYYDADGRPTVPDKTSAERAKYAGVKRVKRDYIEVVEEYETTKKGNTVEVKPKVKKIYESIHDFTYEDQIIIADENGEEREVTVPMSAIVVAIEDLDEAGSDYDYTDMVFTLHVSPSMGDGPKMVPGVSTETNKYVQWWELDPNAGLTGGESQTAISTTQIPGVDLSDAEHFKDYFEWVFGTGEEVTVSATVFGSDENGLKQTYNRVQFDNDLKLVLPSGFKSGDTLYFYGAWAKEANKSTPEETRYDPNKYDDIIDFINKHMTIGGESVKDSYLYTDKNAEPPVLMTPVERKLKGLRAMRDMVEAKGGKLEDIQFRIGTIGALYDLVNGDGEMTDDSGKVFKTREEQYTGRRQASAIFGGQSVNVNIAQTDADLNRELDPDDPSGQRLLPAEKQNLLFVGTEVPPGRGAIEVNEINLQQERDFYFDHLIKYDDIPHHADDKAAKTIASRVFLAESIDPSATKAVMDKLYRPMLDADLSNKIYSDLSIEDNRYQLGWRRGGTDDNAEVLNMLDLYVPVLLAAKNHQPFEEAKPVNGVADDPVIIAKKYIEFGEIGDKTVAAYMTKLKSGEAAPQFIVDRALDGAGVLVVAGDLLVRSNFAYHGTLIVCGNLTVEPTLGPGFVKDENGNYLDADGHRLYQDTDGKWFYIETIYDENNNVVEENVKYTDENGQDVKPASSDEILQGDLIVQGQLLVDGKVETKAAVDKNGNVILGADGKPITGSINVVASREATDLVKDLRDSDGNELGRFATHRVVWDVNANMPVDYLWDDLAN